MCEIVICAHDHGWIRASLPKILKIGYADVGMVSVVILFMITCMRCLTYWDLILLPGGGALHLKDFDLHLG